LQGSGIYRLASNSGKCYIGSAGSSRGILRRLKDHLIMLERGSHHSKKLQAAWNKYGELHITILERVTERLIEREQFYIDFYRSATEGYNSNPIAGKTRLGTKLSEETKEKIRVANTGKKASEETKKLMREVAKRKMEEDPEFGKKRSQKLVGVPRSEEFKAGRRAFKHSEETRERMKGPKSDEHKMKITEGLKGKPKSEEHRKNIAASRLGKKFNHHE